MPVNLFDSIVAKLRLSEYNRTTVFYCKYRATSTIASLTDHQEKKSRIPKILL